MLTHRVHPSLSLWLLVCCLLVGGCSKPPEVVVVKAETRRLEVTFSERAETVLRRDFPVSLPVSGRIGRIELEPGDRVRKGEQLVAFDATPVSKQVQARSANVRAQVLRQRNLSDTSVEQSQVTAARRALGTVQAERARMGPAISAARTALDNARREVKRVSALVASGALPARDQETAQLALDRAEAELSARRAESSALQAREREAAAQVSAAEAVLGRRLDEATVQQANVSEAETYRQQDEYTLQKTDITSPIDGVVLERHVRGPQELPAGSQLLSLGRLEDLEAVCDVLSQDALRLARGTPVLLDAGSAYDHPLKGEVRLKEPQGFTKRSSLGVEQQRVRIRIGLLDPPEDLGAGYELWARFVLQQKTALSLPSSCFVRQGEGYSVWRVNGRKLELLEVEVGTRGENHWEVTSNNLNEGDTVVETPSDQLQADQEVVIAY